MIYTFNTATTSIYSLNAHCHIHTHVFNKLLVFFQFQEDTILKYGQVKLLFRYPVFKKLEDYEDYFTYSIIRDFYFNPRDTRPSFACS